MKRQEWANSAINYVLVLFAFLMPISTAMTNTALALLIVLWLIEGEWKRKFTLFKASVPFKVYAAFIAIIGLSFLWSESIDGGFKTAHSSNNIIFYIRIYIFGFMIIPIILTSMKKEFIRYILSAFLAAILISEFMSWSIFMEWIQYKNIPPHDPAPFMHHTFYSVFLAVTVFVLVTQFFQTKTRLYKILIALFILSALVNLFLNGGRLGQLSFFVTLFVYIGLRYRITVKSIGLSALLAIFIFTLAYKTSPVFEKRMDLSLQSLQNIYKGNYYSSWGVRTNILIVAKELVKENPILGTGVGSAKAKFLKKAKEFPQTENFTKLNHLHNGYMQILVETGLVGLLLFLFFLYKLLQVPIKRDVYILLVSIITIYLVGFVGEPLFFSRKPYLLFNLFIAIILFKALNESNPKRPSDA